jgi:hypothetical protein
MTRKPSAERRRDEHTTWYNDEPITDIHEVLGVLVMERRGSLCRYIDIGPYRADTTKPELHVEWYTEGDSGGDMSGWHYLQIDPGLVKQLVDKGYVEPKKNLYLGGFSLDQEKLILSQEGIRHLKWLDGEKKRIAVSLMRPGVYEELSPLYDERRVFATRDGRYGGKLHFKFEMLNGDEVLVFPDTNQTAVKLAEKKVDA